jgi:hypothetical protein
MKKILKFLFLTLILVFAACSSRGIEQLRNDVLKSIEDKTASEGDGIEIVSFTLTHVNGNEYVGVLETLENGEAFSYPVNVVSDGSTFVWEIPPTEAVESNEENIDSIDYTSESNDESPSEENYDKDRTNMVEAMERISDPTFCSLCKGTGIEKNTAKEIFGGPDARVCPMCEGRGRRTY